MPRPKMTENHRRLIRAQILDRAYAVLIEKGPDHISSRAIAQEMDLTHMGLFTYFPNQAAIGRELAEREQSKLLDQMQAIIKPAENEDISRVVGNVLHYLQDFARDNPNLFRLIWVAPETASPPRWIQLTIDLIAGLLRKGVEKGFFLTSDVQCSALLVVSLVNLPYIMAYSEKITGPEVREKLSREALAAAMQYLKTGIEPGRPTGLGSWTAFTGWLTQNWAFIGLSMGNFLILLSPIILHGLGWIVTLIYLQIPLLLFQQLSGYAQNANKVRQVSWIKRLGVWLLWMFIFYLAVYAWLPAGLILVYLVIFNAISTLAGGFRARRPSTYMTANLLLWLPVGFASLFAFSTLPNVNGPDQLLGAVIAAILHFFWVD